MYLLECEKRVASLSANGTYFITVNVPSNIHDDKALGIKRFAPVIAVFRNNQCLFRNRMGNRYNGLYHNMGGVAMSKEKYIQELEDALEKSNYSFAESLACIRYASNLLNSELPVIFDRIHLSLLLGIKPSNLSALIYSTDSYCYHELRLSKKDGGTRVINIPSVNLKYIQRWILDNILSKMRISEFANGFCPGKSILTNAVPHIGKECVINLDIKDFFPSISMDRVFMLFKYYGYTKEVSFALAKICTYKGILPQGSPASPAITNALCLKLDKRLSGLAKSYNGVYSRYADDLTFSGKKNITQLMPIAIKIIEDEGFCINERKTHIAFSHERQEVTGLLVNEGGVKVSQKYKKRLRQEIYYCQKFGVSDHQQHCDENFQFYKEHLYGKAYFISMVEPDIGNRFLEALDNIVWEY